MSENEKLNLILEGIGEIKDDVRGLKEDVQGLKEDVQGLKEDVQGLKEEVQVLKEDVQGLKEEVQVLNEDVQVLKEDVQTLKEDVQSVKERVTLFEITLENETNRNIQLIAEGHMNLDRKLDEALKELHPNTMYHLKVNHLDGEVTKMKRVLNMA